MKYQKIKYAALSALIFLPIMFLSVSRANAQGDAVSKMAQKMTDSLAYLQLNDQQKTQAVGFNTTAATSLVQTMQKAKTDTTFKGKALAQQVMGVMKQRNDALKKILTPDQQKLYQQHQVQQMAELQTQMMKAQLDLTDTQMPQVYSVNLKSTKEMMADMEELKSAKRKLQKARDAKALKSTSGDKDKEMKKILTSDQYTKYEKNKEQMQAAMKEKMNEKKGK
ncbi:MAG TPA: hypothetical protein VGN20_08055 [Mucilaginibacter sp.]|jgi:hypothetical protein